jgi:signal transduction histidine kinase
MVGEAMFSTLRSKLIFSSCVVALVCLMLAAAGTIAFAGDYVQQTSLKTLAEKRSLAAPLLRLWLTNNQRPQTPGRSMVLAGILESLRAANIRVLLVDPINLKIVEDSSAKYNAVGETFDFNRDDAQLEQGLTAPGGITGIVQLKGEPDRNEYMAQRIRPLRLANITGGGGQGNGTTETGPYFADIVVFAQPQVRLLGSLLGDFRSVLLPAVLIALLISLAVAYLLARSISRPITKLATATAAIARGDYSQRLPVEGRDELSALTNQFNQMASEVERARRAQRDFVANVSHDLKTPLTSIQGFSQAILDGTITERRGYAQAAHIINDEALRMSRLVDELLSLTKLENGLISLELHPTDISQLVSQLVAAMQPQASSYSVHLAARIETGGNAMALADVDRLKQAFGNLIDNALKHTPEGGYVSVEVSSVQQGVQVLVRDTGEGIPPEDLPRVMERFYQVDKARSSGSRSLGLGLAIAREIVHAHRGQISVESRVGVGTAFRVILPAEAPMSAPQQGGMRRLLRGKQTTQPLMTEPAPIYIPGTSGNEQHAVGPVSGNGTHPAN